MSVITEAALRVLLKDEDLDALDEYRVAAGVIVTPSAKAYLIDHRIDLIVGDKRIIKTPGHENRGATAAGAASADAAPAAGPPAGTVPAGTVPTGTVTASTVPASTVPASTATPTGTAPAGSAPGKKPEYMTALHGRELVFKDHKAIKLRGKVDSFEAMALETQFTLKAKGYAKAADDLGAVIGYTRKLMRCEVLGEDVPPMELFGMGADEIHERSHRPHKFYGFGHFMPVTVDDGELILRLNALRASVREAELCAYEAYRDAQGIPARADIVEGYNRLSSALYVMMFKAKAKEYEADT